MEYHSGCPRQALRHSLFLCFVIETYGGTDSPDVYPGTPPALSPFSPGTRRQRVESQKFLAMSPGAHLSSVKGSRVAFSFGFSSFGETGEGSNCGPSDIVGEITRAHF